MRQLLMLGFYCEVYRREPLCRVYVNDVLADEFNIPHSEEVAVEMNSFRGWNPLNPTYLDPLLPRKRLENFITNPSFLKYIEFDDAGADSLDVVLRIQNDDNNYANGFMSRYTHITLSHLFLNSRKVLENINNIKNNFKFSRKNWEKCKRNIVDWYTYNNRNQIFENLIHNTTPNFPGCNIIPNEHLGTYKIGSSGHYHLTLKKKLGLWNTGKRNSKGIWRLGYIDHVKYLYDKYKQYEDKRSNDR